MPRVLIVDDEPAIVMAVRDELQFEGMQVETAGDGLSAIDAALRLRPEVMLLDLMLPEMNGFEVCRRVRPQLPDSWVIVLTARGEEVDRITGFEAGADDYVVKPFSLRELVARIRVGLKRRGGPPRTARSVEPVGDLMVDIRARRLTRHGVEIPLTRKEFEILLLLLRRRGEVIPRDEFCDLIWGPEVYITPRVIDTHVAGLRKKIEDGTGPANTRSCRITCIRGVGYRMEPEL
jgi:DNA-binding response OmpR family regulator